MGGEGGAGGSLGTMGTRPRATAALRDVGHLRDRGGCCSHHSCSICPSVCLSVHPSFSPALY